MIALQPELRVAPGAVIALSLESFKGRRRWFRRRNPKLYFVTVSLTGGVAVKIGPYASETEARRRYGEFCNAYEAGE